MDEDKKFRSLVAQTMLALLDGEIYQRRIQRGESKREYADIVELRSDIDSYLLDLVN